MEKQTEPTEQENLEEQHAVQGAGPLLQRDYWLAMEHSERAPVEIIDLLAHDFPRFSPDKIAEFSFVHIPPLKVGSEMKVHILGYGECHVRVSARESRSLTLITLEDHYEAGRITFGAWVNDKGQTVLKIRSRARTRSKRHVLSFAVLGHAVQKQLWVQFLRNLARACQKQDEKQDEERDFEVHESTEPVEETAADCGERNTPTFSA